MYVDPTGDTTTPAATSSTSTPTISATGTSGTGQGVHRDRGGSQRRRRRGRRRHCTSGFSAVHLAGGHARHARRSRPWRHPDRSASTATTALAASTGVLDSAASERCWQHVAGRARPRDGRRCSASRAYWIEADGSSATLVLRCRRDPGVPHVPPAGLGRPRFHDRVPRGRERLGGGAARNRWHLPRVRLPSLAPDTVTPVVPAAGCSRCRSTAGVTPTPRSPRSSPRTGATSARYAAGAVTKLFDLPADHRRPPVRCSSPRSRSAASTTVRRRVSTASRPGRGPLDGGELQAGAPPQPTGHEPLRVRRPHPDHGCRRRPRVRRRPAPCAPSPGSPTPAR